MCVASSSLSENGMACDHLLIGTAKHGLNRGAARTQGRRGNKEIVRLFEPTITPAHETTQLPSMRSLNLGCMTRSIFGS
jgi:hypothetical protein